VTPYEVVIKKGVAHTMTLQRQCHQLQPGQRFSFDPDPNPVNVVTDVDLIDKEGNVRFLYYDGDGNDLHGHCADHTAVWVQD
jgi:hypothetical protein